MCSELRAWRRGGNCLSPDGRGCPPRGRRGDYPARATARPTPPPPSTAPLRSSDRAAGGTGLGLAIVKHIVERHRGRLDIASVVGVGTTITIVLPLASDMS